MKIKQIMVVSVLTFTCLAQTPKAVAGTEPYIGEISWFAGNFAPRGWAKCDGQLLSISQNTALFSILGTQYGGDGRSTFALPDVRGRTVIHSGRGPGLSDRRIGSKGGTEIETLTINQIPSHSHDFKASSGGANTATPSNNVLANTGRTRIYEGGAPNVNLSSASITSTGGGQSHNNMQPYTTLNCIIALQGIFPSRN